MEDDSQQKRTKVALFRHGVLGELVHLKPGTRGLTSSLEQKAAKEYCIPFSNRTTIAAETIRDWLKAYRQGGFDALLPKERGDAGQSRTLSQAVADLLMSLKEEHPKWSVLKVIEEAQKHPEVSSKQPLPPSTVHRFLSHHGLMGRKEPDSPSSKDHRRFAFLKAGDLWMSDVMHGPAVFSEGRRKRKAYLIAFIDDATRVIPHAAFTFSENCEAFLDVFQQALLRRGIPKRLFVDNGAAYRTHQLALVCAKLSITLIHARPYHPQAKGKIERWFRTVRMQFLPLLTPDDTASLEALNSRLGGYIEGEYHQTPHRGLEGQTPFDRWACSADEVKYLSPDINIDDLFLFEAKRKVQKDRTISLQGVLYEVDAALVGETVALRYNPSRRGQPIQVWFKGHHVHNAKVVDAYANCFVKRSRPSLNPELLAHKAGPPSNKTVTPSTQASPAPPPPQGLRLSDLLEPQAIRDVNIEDKENL